MRNFEELNIWKEAKELVLDVYGLMSSTRDYGFKDQIQRAAVSIMNNIAEGSEAGTDIMFIRYLNITKGSCAEVRSMLYLCADLKFCTREQSHELINKTLRISRGVSKLITYLKNSKREMTKDTGQRTRV